MHDARRWRTTPRGRAHQLWHAARQRAVKKGVEISISVDWVEAQIVKNKCAISGLPFDLSFEKPSRARTPSIDRIDCSKGYVDGNCRIVLFALNAALGDWGESELRSIVETWLSQ